MCCGDCGEVYSLLATSFSALFSMMRPGKKDSKTGMHFSFSLERDWPLGQMQMPSEHTSPKEM